MDLKMRTEQMKSVLLMKKIFSNQLFSIKTYSTQTANIPSWQGKNKQATFSLHSNPPFPQNILYKQTKTLLHKRVWIVVLVYVLACGCAVLLLLLLFFVVFTYDNNNR